MRPRFVLALIVCVVLAAGIALIIKPHQEKTSAVAEVSPAPAAVPQPASANPLPPPLPLPTPAAPAPRVLTDEERQAANQAEIDRLQQWEMNDDPQSLSNILADLTNSEKEVREAAIEATKQFSSTNAIPALKAAAINSTDPQEQIEMLQAANFLTLTPFSDPSIQVPRTPAEIQAVAQQRAQEQALKQARLQQRQQQNGAPAQTPAPAPPSAGN